MRIAITRDQYDAVLLDLDGVITERGEAFRPFELATDYRLGGYTPRGGTRRK
jgi:hypothetical protein